MSSIDFASIMESFGSPAAADVATSLRAFNPTWQIDAGYLDTFADKFCRTDGSQVTSELLDRLPGAQLAAAPAILQALNLVYRRCHVDAPQNLDAASIQILFALKANTPSGAPPNPVPSNPVPSNPVPSGNAASQFDQAVCAAGSVFATPWAKDAFKGKRSGLYVLAGIAAAMVFCPGIVGGIVGR